MTQGLLVEEVDSVEGTRCGRLVLKLETNSTHEHEATLRLPHWPPVQSQWFVMEFTGRNGSALPIRDWDRGLGRCVLFSDTVTRLAVQPCSATERAAGAVDLL